MEEDCIDFQIIKEFLKTNEDISLLILSYLQEFFVENVSFNNLILKVKYN